MDAPWLVKALDFLRGRRRQPASGPTSLELADAAQNAEIAALVAERSASRGTEWIGLDEAIAQLGFNPFVEIDPQVMGGEPVIKGTRITRRGIKRRIEGGETIAELLADYPYVPREAIEAAIAFQDDRPEPGPPPWRRDEVEPLRAAAQLAREQIHAGHPDWANLTLRDALRGHDPRPVPPQIRVYVVSSDVAGDWWVEGVFSSRERAEAFIDALPPELERPCDIWERDLDAGDDRTDNEALLAD